MGKPRCQLKGPPTYGSAASVNKTRLPALAAPELAEFCQRQFS